MFLRAHCLLFLLLVGAKTFEDPAPPTAKVPSDVATASKENPDVVFHRPPAKLAADAVTEDWPTFLGPRHNNISIETRLIKSFPKEGPSIVWEVKRGSEKGGAGYAAPVIVDGKLILFHRVGDEEVVDCLEAQTGRRYWRYGYKVEYTDRYGYNDGPRCSPAIDGGRVYTYGVSGRLHCLSLASGEVCWSRDILAEFKIKQNFFGVGAPPLIVGDLLILNIGAPGGPTVAAFDKATGKLAWGAGEQWGPSYASPIPAVIRGQRRILVFAGGESRPATGGLICINPANGAVDFEFPWRSSRYESVNASSPVVFDNKIFISECYSAWSTLLEIDGKFQPRQLWTNEEFGTHFMTAIYKDGYLYGVHGHGPLDSPVVCLDAKTGKETWRVEPELVEEIPTRDGQIRRQQLSTARASLLLVDGRLLCLGEYGHLLWLEPTAAGYKELSRCWLFAAGETWTPPVVSKGLLYVCQNTRDGVHKKETRLICYDLRTVARASSHNRPVFRKNS